MKRKGMRKVKRSHHAAWLLLTAKSTSTEDGFFKRPFFPECPRRSAWMAH